MMKLLDLNYYAHHDISVPGEVIALHRPSNRFAEILKSKIQCCFVKHSGFEGVDAIDDIPCFFFRSYNNFWFIPFKTHNHVRTLHPDVILVQGFVFPLQVIFLKLLLGKQTHLLVQHHGERPMKGLKGWLQQFADRYISRYLFTEKGNAREWLDKKIISEEGKCVEILPASSYFKNAGCLACKQQLGFENNLNFLWVGRLNANKDPLTVLQAFELFLTQKPEARLYMVYQTTDLLPEVLAFKEKNEVLHNAIITVGPVPKEELPVWYSAADFYLSASHQESCGYALLEAMACGCIPIVSNIPSFRKLTANGSYGLLFEPANVPSLLATLLLTEGINREDFSKKVLQHFSESLSYESIAENMYQLCLELTGK